jgi:hypothetical protein
MATEIITTKDGIELIKKTKKNGQYWLEQNSEKNSEWAKLANRGYKIFHLFLETGDYAGVIKVDGIIYSYELAREMFL